VNPARIRAPIVVTRAATITASLSDRLPSIRRLLDGDIDPAFTGDPAARSIPPAASSPRPSPGATGSETAAESDAVRGTRFQDA